MARTCTVEEIDAEYQPTKARAVICMDSDLVLSIERDEETLEAQRRAGDVAGARETAERIDEARMRARGAEVEFVFRGIGHGPYDRMIAAHPPTSAQRRQIGEDITLRWNADTFPPVLLAASCESPADTTVEWWTEKLDRWGAGQIHRAWAACLAAQTGVTEVPKVAAAYAVLREAAAS